MAKIRYRGSESGIRIEELDLVSCKGTKHFIMLAKALVARVRYCVLKIKLS